MECHGRLEFTWQEDRLYVNAFGPFNDEGAAQAGKAYLDIIANKPVEHFAVVEVLDPESLGSPNTMGEVRKLWDFLGASGCYALALVYSNSVQHALAAEFMTPFGAVFADVASAERWVEQQLAPSS